MDVSGFHEDIQNLSTQIESLESQATVKQAEVDEYRQRAEAAENQLVNLSSILQAEATRVLSQEYEKWNIVNKGVTERLEASEHKVKSLQEALSGQEVELENERKRSKELTSQLSDNDQKSRTEETRLELLRSELNRVKEDKEMEIERLRGTISGLNSQMAEMMARLTQSQSAREQLAEQLSLASEREKELVEQSEVEEQAELLNQAREDTRKAEQEMMELRNEMEKASSENMRLSVAVSHETELRLNLERKLSNEQKQQESTIKMVKGELQQLNEFYQSSEKEHLKTISNLKSELQEAEKTLQLTKQGFVLEETAVSRELERFKAMYEELSGICSRQQHEIDNLEMVNSSFKLHQRTNSVATMSINPSNASFYSDGRSHSNHVQSQQKQQQHHQPHVQQTQENSFHPPSPEHITSNDTVNAFDHNNIQITNNSNNNNNDHHRIEQQTNVSMSVQSSNKNITMVNSKSQMSQASAPSIDQQQQPQQQQSTFKPRAHPSVLDTSVGSYGDTSHVAGATTAELLHFDGSAGLNISNITDSTIGDDHMNQSMASSTNQKPPKPRSRNRKGHKKTIHKKPSPLLEVPLSEKEAGRRYQDSKKKAKAIRRKVKQIEQEHNDENKHNNEDSNNELDNHHHQQQQLPSQQHREQLPSRSSFHSQHSFQGSQYQQQHSIDPENQNTNILDSLLNEARPQTPPANHFSEVHEDNIQHEPNDRHVLDAIQASLDKTTSQPLSVEERIRDLATSNGIDPVELFATIPDILKENLANQRPNTSIMRTAASTNNVHHQRRPQTSINNHRNSNDTLIDSAPSPVIKRSTKKKWPFPGLLPPGTLTTRGRPPTRRPTEATSPSFSRRHARSTQQQQHQQLVSEFGNGMQSQNQQQHQQHFQALRFDDNTNNSVNYNFENQDHIYHEPIIQTHQQTNGKLINKKPIRISVRPKGKGTQATRTKKKNTSTASSSSIKRKAITPSTNMNTTLNTTITNKKFARVKSKVNSYNTPNINNNNNTSNKTKTQTANKVDTSQIIGRKVAPVRHSTTSALNTSRMSSISKVTTAATGRRFGRSKSVGRVKSRRNSESKPFWK